MTYIDEVRKDVRDWVENNVDLSKYENRDEAENELNDALWIEDSVTGNGSGSYTFDCMEAKRNVFGDTDAVNRALEDFGIPKDEIADHFLREDWEWFDVTARCALLGSAISAVLDDLWKEE